MVVSDGTVRCFLRGVVNLRKQKVRASKNEKAIVTGGMTWRWWLSGGWGGCDGGSRDGMMMGCMCVCVLVCEREKINKYKEYN